MHTRDRRWYALRLLLLAVISEIPFDLVAGGEHGFFPADQNTVFTLLLGLLAGLGRRSDLRDRTGSVIRKTGKKTGDGGRKGGRARGDFRWNMSGNIRVLAAVPFGLAALLSEDGLWVYGRTVDRYIVYIAHGTTASHGCLHSVFILYVYGFLWRCGLRLQFS